MKITYHKTEAQQNRAWYTPERKPIRGTGYTKPVYRTKDYSLLKTFVLALIVGTILLSVYLIRTA